MGKQFGHIIVEKVFEMKRSGQTHREIATELGYTYKQIKELVKRENIRQRKLAAGIVIHKKGRPSKECIVSEEDKIVDLRYKLSRKDYRIKQLEMENELLRDFLKETGRG
jgi:predicted transcriptional regulator